MEYELSIERYRLSQVPGTESSRTRQRFVAAHHSAFPHEIVEGLGLLDAQYPERIPIKCLSFERAYDQRMGESPPNPHDCRRWELPPPMLLSGPSFLRCSLSCSQMISKFSRVSQPASSRCRRMTKVLTLKVCAKRDSASCNRSLRCWTLPVRGQIKTQGLSNPRCNRYRGCFD